MNVHNTLRFESPLGSIILAASEKGLCGLWFDKQRHGPSREQVRNWPRSPGDALLEEAAEQVMTHLLGRRKQFDLPLDLSYGTAFQQDVWQALLLVPCGQSQTYGQLAAQLHKPTAVRAVGSAVGRNPISIIVPCHRILGAGGHLTGYAGGVWRKLALLHIESL
jgi:methylated-DNA-[protein]-cysteine S-methyltransferase